MVSADEARALFLEVGPASSEPKIVALASAVGRVVADDVIAPEDFPAWPRSAMDGYAIRAGDAGGRLHVLGELDIGEVWDGEVGMGLAVGIATGGAMPRGCDTVVMVEHVRRDGDSVVLERAPTIGQHVHRAGEDLRRGELVVGRGRRLRPADLAALAALGIAEVSVRRRPRVAILSTGNELSAGAAPPPGRVRDVNALALASLVARAGGEPRMAGIARDDAFLLRARIEELASAHDLVLVSGGSSVGARDLTARVLFDLGARMRFHGVDIRPGKPTLFAELAGKPVVGLPGVPASAMLVFEAFVRLAIWRLGGEVGRELWPSRRRARLRSAIASQPGREDYVRVRLEPRGEGGDLDAVPLAGNSLSVLQRADGLVIIPADRAGLAAGEEVEVLLS